MWVLWIDFFILVLRLSPCCWCKVFSFGYNPGVWLKWVDVSEPSVSSIFLDWMRRSECRGLSDGTIYWDGGEVATGTSQWEGRLGKNYYSGVGDQGEPMKGGRGEDQVQWSKDEEKG
jgi:hypothetical protein